LTVYDHSFKTKTNLKTSALHKSKRTILDNGTCRVGFYMKPDKGLWDQETALVEMHKWIRIFISLINLL